MPSLQDAVPPSRGLVAGKYELIRIIGRGGMGSVWEGRHTSLGTHVAIKFIEKEFADNDEARKRFDNEARAAAALQSKHAIQIHDHGVTEDGKPYIVMEMLVGEPLDKRIERARIMPLNETARILQQVCRALQKAHEHGIVHRDLKPENIFLVRGPDDDEEIAKVLDFGIAKIRHNAQDQSVSSSTRTGAVLGTPFYMSPEQARGLRDIDHRTDLWSLGVIAFKCTTGRLPFEGESLGDLLVKICTAPLPIPTQLNPTLPPSFDAWFSRALDRDPNRRFASAIELSEALAYAAGVSVRRPAGAPAYTPPSVAMAPGPGTGTAIGHPGMAQPSYGAPYPNMTAQSPPPYAATPAPYGYGTQHPNVTSAPFVSAAGVPKSGGRGALIFGALIAGLIGIGLTVAAVISVSSRQSSAGSTSTPTTQTTAAPTTAIVTPLTTTNNTSATTTQTTATATTAVATTTATAKATGGSGLSGIATDLRTHPTATATATVTYHPATTATVPTATAHPTATATKNGDFGAGF
jgi:serine/threonine protein kinase